MMGYAGYGSGMRIIELFKRAWPIAPGSVINNHWGEQRLHALPGGPSGMSFYDTHVRLMLAYSGTVFYTQRS